MFYVTNAPETYDYGYCSTFMTVTGTNGRDFRVLRVRDVKRFENFQIPRYQSGFVYATFSLDDPKTRLLLGCQVLAEIQKAIEKRSDPATLKSDRVRFNWGYHDGAAEQRRDRVRDVSGHYDPDFGGSVSPDSPCAYNRLIVSTLGYDHPRAARLFRIVRVVDRAQARSSARHERWLRGGVHPLGTPERDSDDAARRARCATVDARCALLLAYIERECAGGSAAEIKYDATLGCSAEWSGHGDTDSDGYSTSDVVISEIEAAKE